MHLTSGIARELCLGHPGSIRAALYQDDGDGKRAGGAAMAVQAIFHTDASGRPIEVVTS